MQLREVMPVDALKARFPDILAKEISGLANMPTFEREHAKELVNLALHQWDRIVAFGPDDIDPMAIAKWVEREDPGLCRRVSKILGRPLVQDILYAEMSVRRGSEAVTVAEIMVAHLYPGDLHLA